MATRLLLLSNSRSADGAYLRWPMAAIQSFLESRVKSVLFVPYAAVPATQESYSSYADEVRAPFGEMGYELRSIHEFGDPVAAVNAAEAIVVGGGNTFQLLTQIYANQLLEPIVDRVRSGTPYIGWSAGANLACPTLRTTNDMPIIEPPSFKALNLVPFQINPHYTDAHPPGHRGETRDERITEFVAMNPQVSVVGLREGALLRCEADEIQLLGSGARVFRAGRQPLEWREGEPAPEL